VCAGYHAGAVLGINLRYPQAGISTIWAPSAIVMAALLLEPPRRWWIYILALLPTHLHVVATFQRDVPLVVMFSQFTGNAILFVGGAIAVRSIGGAPPRFDSLRSMASFVLVAAIGVNAFACLVAVSLFTITGWTTDFWLSWRQRFFTNGMPVLIITPAIVLAAGGRLVGAWHARGQRYVELGVVTCGLLGAGMLAFASDAPRPDLMPALLLAPLPFLLWAAVRLGPGGVCMSLMVVTATTLATVFAGRWPFVTQSATETVLSLHAFLLSISIPIIFLAALVDERRRNDEETRRQRDELAHALRVTTLGELAASIAHELSQPLSAITMNAQAGRSLFRTKQIPEPMGEILNDIEESALRARQVIKRLRALFRKESSQRVSVDIDLVIENATALVRSDLGRKGIMMYFTRDDALHRVVGDPVQLQQVVLNLLVNAADAVSASDDLPREIAIDTQQRRPGELTINVRDNGIGVSDRAQLDVIFKEFVSTKPQGLGMGLTITRSIVEAHGGRVWATANEHRGLTFHVELPAAEQRDKQRVTL